MATVAAAAMASTATAVKAATRARREVKARTRYMFDLHVFDAIRRTPRTAMRDEYEITDSTQILIDDEFDVAHRPAVKQDYNLTVPEDLLAINLLDLERQDLLSLVGAGTTMPDGTVVTSSVIGAGVTITSPSPSTRAWCFRARPSTRPYHSSA